MSKPWKAKLPNVLPDAGKVHFIFAVKTVTGYRMEYSGTCDQEKALTLYQELISAAEGSATP